MSDTPGPVILEGKIDPHTLYAETFSIPKEPTVKEAMKLMDLISRFLTKMAVELLSQEKNEKPQFPASHPAPMAILQAASSLQNGHAQLEMLEAQQRGMISPGQMPQQPRRMN